MWRRKDVWWFPELCGYCLPVLVWCRHHFCFTFVLVAWSKSLKCLAKLPVHVTKGPVFQTMGPGWFPMLFLAVFAGLVHSELQVLCKGPVYSRRTPTGVWFSSMAGSCWELSFNFWLLQPANSVSLLPFFFFFFGLTADPKAKSSDLTHQGEKRRINKHAMSFLLCGGTDALELWASFTYQDCSWTGSQLWPGVRLPQACVSLNSIVADLRHGLEFEPSSLCYVSKSKTGREIITPLLPQQAFPL